MPRKAAGKLNQPPAPAEFNTLPLARLCQRHTGIFYRLHGTDPNGAPWPPVHFSRRGNSRFDAKGGVGALCLAATLAGALMELFDDHWGPVGSMGRSVTEGQLQQTWVTRVSLPTVLLFDATGPNLSKIGTDAQFLTGLYSTTRKWSALLMQHSAEIDGVLYRSRHDLDRLNVALFSRARLLPAMVDNELFATTLTSWSHPRAHKTTLIH